MVDVNVTPLEIEVTTRHGDLVRADVYLPRDRDGPLPVLLGASPYQKALRHLPPVPSVFPFIEYGPIQLYLDEGYAYVAMDVPGMGRSEGIWDPVSRAEGEAIHDLIEHVAKQGWAGPIGMIGMSYYCWSQWNAARTKPPHLVTIAAFDGATDMYRDWMYHGGIPIQGFLNSWLYGSVLLEHMAEGLSITDHGRGQILSQMYEHPFDDAWQRRRSPFWELDQVDIPVLSIGAWGKASLHLRGNFEGYRLVKGPKQLLITGAQTFAEAQLLFFNEKFHRAELLPWYDHHLKGRGNGVMARPQVRFFVQGEGATLSAPAWPPPDATVAEFHLSGATSGNEESLNDGSLVATPQRDVDGDATSWTYPDPKWMAGVTTIDKQGVPHHTARVLTFTTPAFERDREFTGQGVLHLFASSDQTDMDVMVKVSLLPGDPEKPPSIRVSQGWLRASHRAEDPELTTEMRPFLKHDRAEPIEPGKAYEFRIELIPMSVLVAKGERLRLEISNWESAITEAPMTHWYGQKVGTDTYHHDAAHPSRLRLHERPRGIPAEKVPT